MFYFVFLSNVLNEETVNSIARPNRAPLADGIDGAPEVLVMVHVFLLVDEEVFCLLMAESFRVVQARMLQVPKVASIVELLLFFL